MIKDYRPSERKEEISYEIVFYSEPGGGFGFPCDEQGNVAIKDLQPAAIKNYEYALAHPEKFPYAYNEIEKRRNTWKEPASGICKCGKRISLTDDYLGACECPHCGQWWNLFGQQLQPVEHWNDYGELMDDEY